MVLGGRPRTAGTRSSSVVHSKSRTNVHPNKPYKRVRLRVRTLRTQEHMSLWQHTSALDHPLMFYGFGLVQRRGCFFGVEGRPPVS